MPDPPLPPNATEILQHAQKAQHAQQAQAAAKAAADRSLQAALNVLHENPAGVLRSELLAAADSDNIISLSMRIRTHLKQEGRYALQKRRKPPKVTYYLLKQAE